MGALAAVTIIAGFAVASGADPPAQIPVESSASEGVAAPLALRTGEVRSAHSLCPEASPVPVVDGIVYPPAFPWAPVGGPDRCYADVANATAAGHRLPDLPADAERVAGVYLLSDTSAVADCLRAASVVGHAIPCPPRQPHGGERVRCVGTCLRGGGYVLSIRRFEVPSRWCEGCVPEVVITAAPTDAPALVSALTGCGSRSPEVDREGLLSECRVEPAAWAGLVPHAGNTLRRGQADGIAYAVSAAGHGQPQAALVNHVFDSLSIVTP